MRRLDRQDGFDDLRDQMQRMLNQFQNLGKQAGVTGVPVDMREEDNEIVLTADIPGVTKDDINIKTDENRLEITAEAKQEIKEENEKYIRKERSSRKFSRKISWPTKIDPESIKAKYDEGVLTVRAEKEGDSDDWNVEIE
ncbi:MAG: Hsp20/alpha crystallin family protein [Nanohaloarchaea archaeon]|nr:Hsp20/alpha crystallin family protein [Candidatus Nanohaloarchaea archaeon]